MEIFFTRSRPYKKNDQATIESKTRLWLKTLRRRSQRTTITWARMSRLETRWLPKVRIMHPYPNVRLAAKTRGRSPVR